MKSVVLHLFITTCILIVMTLSTKGQDFVYTPLNPAFGGSYLNYSWLLNSANAQNTISEESESYSYRGYQYDPFASFEQDLQRRFFSELSSQIMNNFFGEGAESEQIEEGQYRFGSYEINVFSDQQGVNVEIKDYQKGSETTITLPYY